MCNSKGRRLSECCLRSLGETSGCIAYQQHIKALTAMPVPTVPLGQTGMQVSILGMGCSPIGHSYGVANEQTAIHTVHAAYKAGINIFDVSPYYGSGRAEKLLGAAIKTLPREDIIICTKIGKYAPGEEPNYSAKQVQASIHDSMQRLGVDYIDILHCHDIEFCPDMRQIINETLPCLLELKKQGKIRAIGITGYPLDIFSYILDRVPLGTVDVVLSYCHNSLHDTSMLQLLPYLQSKGVGVISAAPLCMGLWRPQGPESWHPAPAGLKQAAKQCADIAAQHNLSLPRLAIKAAIAQAGDGVQVHLMGMASPTEVEQNVDVILEMTRATPGTACGGVATGSNLTPESHSNAPAAASTAEADSNGATEQQGTVAAGLGDNKHKNRKPLKLANGFSDEEHQVLEQLREVLQPVKDVTWPVGLTNNRQ